MSGLTDVLSLSTFCQGFWTPTRRVNVHIIVFIVRTNTGQLSHLCPAFVLAQALGPSPTHHLISCPLSQTIDKCWAMSYLCIAFVQPEKVWQYPDVMLLITCHPHPSQTAHCPLPMRPPLPTNCPPAPHMPS